MKHRKQPSDSGLRKRVAAFASEKVQIDGIVDKGYRHEPMKEADIAIEEIEFDGKHHIRCPYLSLEGAEKHLCDFERGLAEGMIGEMKVKRKPLLVGRLIGKETHAGHQAYLTALMTVGSGITAFFANGEEIRISILRRDTEIPRVHIRNAMPDKNKAAVLDLSKILDEAVARTCFFRHMELDHYPPIILSPSDPKKDEIVRERLRWLKGDTADLIGKGISKLKGRIGKSLKTRLGTEDATMTVYRALRFDQSFSKSMDESDIEQVIRLGNLMARSSMISAVSTCIVSGMSERRMRTLGYTEPWQIELFEEFLGKMAELAYGSPYLRLCDMERRMIVEGSDSKEHFFMKVGLVQVLKSVFSPRPSSSEDELRMVLGTSEDEWRDAGAAALEEICREIGYSFHSIPGILDVFSQINRTDYLTMDNLPLIASVWREVYG